MMVGVVVACFRLAASKPARISALVLVSTSAEKDRFFNSATNETRRAELVDSSGGDLHSRSPLVEEEEEEVSEEGGCGDMDWKMLAIALTLLPIRRPVQATG